jgi:hypothetical protein
MSKESVNRTVTALAVLLGLVALARPACAQVALVVGSVRDQHGAAVQGASVTAASPSGPASAVTDAAGTFALSGSGIASVTVSCRFCATAIFPVPAGQPIVAIVTRYDALADVAPSAADFGALPYAHVESVMSLRPFTLLRQTTTTYPGSEISDRGLQPSNSLLVDANVPNYDIVFGASPYTTIPAHYEQSGSIDSAAFAFLYGDQAGSGVVNLQPFGGENADVALLGSDEILRLQAGTDALRVAAGTYSNSTESRQRADAQVTLPLSSAETFELNAGTSQGRQYESPGGATLASNFTFANAAFDDAQRTLDLHGSFSYDRGDYFADNPFAPITDVWSDADFTAGVRTRGTVQAFADVSDRLSTGIYDAQLAGTPRIGATLTQARLDAGLQTSGPDFDATAGVGFFAFGFGGGTGGVSTPSYGRLAVPALHVDLFPQSKWSATLEAAGSFDLPTMWDQYGYNDNYGAVVYDRASLYSAALSYTDDARVRVTVEEASQFIHGFTNGTVTSTGASLTWQLAPLFSLRAWTMLASNATVPSGQVFYYADGVQPNVNAMWLTYDNRGAVRIDAIYRKDLLDGAPFYHVDGDVSGPISHGLRWYAGVEDQLQSTHVNVGLRFAP